MDGGGTMAFAERRLVTGEKRSLKPGFPRIRSRIRHNRPWNRPMNKGFPRLHREPIRRIQWVKAETALSEWFSTVA